MAIKDIEGMFSSLDPEYYDILMKWVFLFLYIFFFSSLKSVPLKKKIGYEVKVLCLSKEAAATNKAALSRKM